MREVIRTIIEAALIVIIVIFLFMGSFRAVVIPIITIPLSLIGVAMVMQAFGFTLNLLTLLAMVLAIGLTLSPMMSSRLLRSKHKPGKFEDRVHRVLDRIDSVYSRSLDAVLAHRPVFLVFALIVLGSLPFLFRLISTELAPAEDNGFLLLVVTGPDHANLDFIERHMKVVNQIAMDDPAADTMLTLAGMPQANSGIAIPVLTPWSERESSEQVVQQRMSGQMQEIVGVRASPFSMPPLPGASGGMPVQFVIKSPGDYQTLFKLAMEIDSAAKASGLFMFTRLDLNFTSANVSVNINRIKAGAYGVTMQAIGSAVSMLMGDGYINRISIDNRSYEVIPQVIRKDRLTPESIGEFFVKARDGRPVPLKNLIDFKVSGQPRSLNQFNQVNAATFNQVNAATISGVMAMGTGMGEAVGFLQQEAARTLPKGFTYSFLGESRQYVEEGTALYMTFLLALLIIYLVLAAQFESLRDPLVILVSVPMAICGALLMMGFGLTTMTIYSQIGLITLVGLISKHGILICEVAREHQLREQRGRFIAVRDAARICLRPILMTTAAMVTGLIPLLMAEGAGAASRFAIGVVIVSGLSVGTLVTLFVLPVVNTYVASKHQPLPEFDETAEVAGN
jgi:multidrug efflux pump